MTIAPHGPHPAEAANFGAAFGDAAIDTELSEAERLQADLNTAAPMLRHLRTQNQILECPPRVEDGKPVEAMRVSPYYFGKGAPSTLGIWKLERVDQPPVFVYSDDAHEARGEGIQLSKKLSIKREVEPLDPDEARACADLLLAPAKYFNEKQAKQPAEKPVAAQPEPRRRKLGRWLLGSK